MKAIIGKKVGMTQIFVEDGSLVPVTVIESQGIVVVQKKTVDKDGYDAIQVGFGEIKAKNVNKPKTGHFEKAEVEATRLLREFKVEDLDAYEVGQVITVETFAAGDKIDVVATSKGKGTAGVIKRHGHSRGPETHGSKSHRVTGSLGSSAYPGRVVKGMKSAGRMGNERVTIQNLEVVRVDAEKNLLLVKGAVPGPKKGFVTVKESFR